MIHCLGDSHVSVFSGQDGMQPTFPNERDVNGKFDRCNLIEGIIQYRLGPYTAYNFASKPSVKETLYENVHIEDDYAFFSAGEIDCRAHVRTQAEEQTRSIEDVANECVIRYFNHIKEFSDTGYKVGFIGPHVFHRAPDDVVLATKTFNDTLKELCTEHGLFYVSAFELTAYNPSPTHYLQNDYVHLSITTISEFERQFKELGVL